MLDMKCLRVCSLTLLTLVLVGISAACFLYHSYSGADRARVSLKERIFGSLEIVLLEISAKAGDVSAQYELGFRLLYGFGADVNRVKGFEWLERAAQGGHINAQYELGFRLYHGLGIEMNRVKGLVCLELVASESGEQWPQTTLGKILYDDEGLGSRARGLELLRRSSDNADKLAQIFLGKIFYSGRGVAQNRSKGIKYLELAAGSKGDRLGESEAQALLGEIFFYGLGTQKNQARGLECLERATGLGEPQTKALYLYGIILYNGHSIAKNEANGLELLTRAAVYGDARAQDFLS